MTEMGRIDLNTIFGSMFMHIISCSNVLYPESDNYDLEDIFIIISLARLILIVAFAVSVEFI